MAQGGNGSLMVSVSGIRGRVGESLTPENVVTYAAAFGAWARAAVLPVLAVDNLPGARPIETAQLPGACVLLFGQEGTGLSAEAREVADDVLSIAQFGSTRPINAGVAAGIAMHAWIRRHAEVR